jgi:hypothetical protein
MEEGRNARGILGQKTKTDRNPLYNDKAIAGNEALHPASITPPKNPPIQN